MQSNIVRLVLIAKEMQLGLSESETCDDEDRKGEISKEKTTECVV